MAKRKLPDPAVTIATFIKNMAKAAGDAGWMLARTVGDGSERSFALVSIDLNNSLEIKFFAKLSQSSTGWWGVMPARAKELVAEHQPLVLLTGASRGYFIAPPRVGPTLRRASRSAVQIEISESKIKANPYFISADQLVQLLLQSSPTSLHGAAG